MTANLWAWGRLEPPRDELEAWRPGLRPHRGTQALGPMAMGSG